jgi:hypothetical protein
MLNFPGAAAPGLDISSLLTPSPNDQSQGEGQQVYSRDSGDETMRFLEAAIKSAQDATQMTVPSYNSPNTAAYVDSLKVLRSLHKGDLANIDEQQKLFESASQAEKQAMQAHATAEIEKSTADQQKAQQIADIAYQVNHMVGSEGNADRVAEKMGTFRSLNDRAEVLKESVMKDAAALRDESDVSFFDDPGRWLAGMFVIPQLTDKLEAGTKQVDLLNNEISGVQNDINETLSANNAAIEARSKGIPSITSQQAAATNAVIAAKAAEESAKADKELAKQNSTFSGVKFATAVAENSAEHGAAVLAQEKAMQEWRVGMQRIAKAETDALAKLRIVDLMDKMKDRAEIRETLKLASIRMGYPEDFINYTRYARMPPAVQQFVFGQAVGYTGTTPGDSYYNWRDVSAKGLNPGPNMSPQTVKMLSDIHRFAESLPEDQKFALETKGMSKEQQRDIEKTYINQKYKNMALQPTSNPAENPFYEVTPALAAAKYQQLAQTQVGKILEPLIKSTTAPRTEDVVATLIQGSKDVTGNVNPELAADMVSGYYRLNMKVRDSITDFKAVGIIPPAAYPFPYTIGAGPLFKSNRIADLTNRESALRMILEKERAAHFFENTASDVGISGLQ